MAKIGKIWGCNPTTIKNILTAYNIAGRTLSEARRNYLNYQINERAFETIDNADAAYWLGVMYSDGFISKTPKYTAQFGIGVQENDIQWLEQFKSFLQYNGNIQHYTTGTSSYKPGSPYVRLLIGNNKIVADLERLGVVEQKN